MTPEEQIFYRGRPCTEAERAKLLKWLADHPQKPRQKEAEGKPGPRPRYGSSEEEVGQPVEMRRGNVRENTSK